MVDPENITDYDLCNNELEERLLFWVCAAGKNGRTAARCLDVFLELMSCEGSPFACIREHGVARTPPPLPYILRAAGIGCYTSKARTFTEVSNAGLNLRTCTVEDLEKVYGIGMKTSRCFIIHSRLGARHAGLDTHLLKYLRAEGIEDVPKSTPSSKKQYLRLEKEFLRMADEQGKLPSVLDLEIWNKYSVKSTPGT